MTRKYHLALAPGEAGGYVLLPGDPARSALLAQHLEGAREMAFNREFRTFSGRVSGTLVSACSTGVGGPSAAIAVEELAQLGAHTLLRVGTCGGAQPGLEVGDLVVATGAVRSEATPNAYVPLSYPALADHALVAACLEAAAAAGARAHAGVIRSVDALQPDLDPDSVPLAREREAELEVWRRAGVLASDMESATILVLASLRGLRAASLLLCVNQLGAGEIGVLDPALQERLLVVAVDALRRLLERDRAAR